MVDEKDIQSMIHNWDNALHSSAEQKKVVIQWLFDKLSEVHSKS